tara:strand:+ start:1198 stop:1989 length:792 start_codon:yes stop_codon:yes gene_type:complete
MKVLFFLRALPSNSVQIIRRTPPLVFATTVLSIGGLLGFISASKILVDGLKPSANTITVTGASTERIESDIAKWDIKVETIGNSQVDSYKRHSDSIDKTIAFLLSYGVKNNDFQSVALLPASTSKEISKNSITGEITSKKWVTTQWIEIESSDVFNIDETYRKIGELLGKGVLVKPGRPEFTYTQLASKRVDMLAKATKDAHTRAEAIVYQTGSELGSVRKVNTGVFQITVPNSTRVSSWGSYDTSTINKDITAVMGVTFEVN